MLEMICCLCCNAGFDLIVESGLGSDLGTFDLLSMHTFPGGHHSPVEIWREQEKHQTEMNKVVFNILNKYIKEEPCGIVPLTLASKSVSASFVGICAGAVGIAELLCGLHGGKRYDHIIIHLRNLNDRGAVLHSQGNMVQNIAETVSSRSDCNSAAVNAYNFVRASIKKQNLY